MQASYASQMLNKAELTRQHVEPFECRSVGFHATKSHLFIINHGYKTDGNHVLDFNF